MARGRRIDTTALRQLVHTRLDRRDRLPSEWLSERIYKWKVFQCVLLAINLIIVSALTGYIASNKLGLVGGLPVAIIMVCGLCFSKDATTTELDANRRI